MTHHPYITGTLLGLAVGLAIICAIGLLVMRDPFQRMHFASPVVIWSVVLIIIAVWVEEPDWQARIKVVFIGIILMVMNSVLSHATARAIRIQQTGHWPAREEEGIPIVEHGGIAGSEAGGKSDVGGSES